MIDDPYHLERFVAAQDSVYRQVCAELSRGRKLTHWMWFIFPQIAGLGHSAMARQYAITSRCEAEAYLQHAVLGPRLRECTQLVNSIEAANKIPTANKIETTLQQLFGYPDDMKFHSSMTLFAELAIDNQVFATALRMYFAGRPDPLTLARL